MQHVDFLFNAQSAQSWENAYKAGTLNEVQRRFFETKPVEELYDTENDYWELNNLAGDPAYAEVLQRMRKALDDWRMEVRDAGVIPETEYVELAGNTSLYDYVRSASCPYEEIVQASDLAILGNESDVNTFIENLQNENSAVRYWAATGLLVQKENAASAIPALKEAAFDPAGSVAALAAEALYGLGEKETAMQAYLNILSDTTNYKMADRNFALNSIDAINDESPEIIAGVQKFYDRVTAAAEAAATRQAAQRAASAPAGAPAQGGTAQRSAGPAQGGGTAGTFVFNANRYNEYDGTMAEFLLKKWGKWVE